MSDAENALATDLFSGKMDQSESKGIPVIRVSVVLLSIGWIGLLTRLIIGSSF